MWDILVQFSTWAEGNSGQIQIIIALAAIWFAWRGYVALAKQMEDAKAQKEEALQQSGFEIKIQMLNLSASIMEENHKYLVRQNEVLELLECAVQNPDLDIKNKSDVENLIKNLKVKITNTESISDMLLEMNERISKSKGFNLIRDENNIIELLKVLSQTINDSNKMDAAKFKFEYE